jgi:hypothetical protein
MQQAHDMHGVWLVRQSTLSWLQCAAVHMLQSESPSEGDVLRQPASSPAWSMVCSAVGLLSNGLQQSMHTTKVF